jgi:hypothetical protein
MTSVPDPDLDPRAVADAMMRDHHRRQRGYAVLPDKRQEIRAAYDRFQRGARPLSDLTRTMGEYW